MQEASKPRERRSNPERAQATRQLLVASARALFVRRGFAATSTPEIVSAAGLTRGALYHHFRDKTDLLREVLEQEARAVAADIEAAAPVRRSPRAALAAGTAAYLDAMRVPGRTRLLLVDGPAILGVAAMRALDAAHAERTLREGLAAALAESTATAAAAKDRSGMAGRNRAGGRRRRGLALAPLVMLLSAAFDRAALAIDEGEDPAAFRSTLTAIIERILGDEQPESGAASPERRRSE